MEPNIICKYIFMVLLGSLLICLLGSCAFNDEGVSNPPESFAANGLNNERRPSETSPDPPQVTLEASKKLPQPTLEASPEPSQSTPEASLQPPQPTSEAGSEQTNIHSSEGDKTALLSAKKSYKAILLENTDFIDRDNNGKYEEAVNIGSIVKVVTSEANHTATVPKFAIVDMDGDGENEIVLWVRMGRNNDAGFEVLHYQEGKVYGYYFLYRGFLSLKTDGTFEGSGGAANSSINKMVFSEDGYSQDVLYKCDGSMEPGKDGGFQMEYFANGEPCSEEEFNEALNRQKEKLDVVWYELTPENVNLAFENRF